VICDVVKIMVVSAGVRMLAGIPTRQGCKTFLIFFLFMVSQFEM
jgi:hypothetical protein